MEFSLIVFSKFSKFSAKKYLSLKWLKLATSYLRDQDGTTGPAGHVFEKRSLN